MSSDMLLATRPRRAGMIGRPRISRPALVLAVILTSQLMVVLDATIVNVALPDMQRALSFSPTQLSWVLNAYTLAFGGLLLLGARAGDLLGRRSTFLVGISIFTIASLVGGFATTGWFLLAARGLQGVGGALAAPSSLALLATMFPDGRERIRAIGLFTLVSVGGGAIGLIAGGMLVEWTSWRWVLFVNVPIGAVVFAIGRGALPETVRKHGKFDLGGALTSTLGMTSLVYGFVRAASDGWGDRYTMAAFAAGIALLISFVLVELRAAEPITPLRLLTNPTRSAANVTRGLIYAGMFGMFFFLTQFLQDVLGYSPLRAGLAFLPMPISIFVSSQLATRVFVTRFNAKPLMVIGVALSMAGMLLASTLSGSSSYPIVVACLMLVGAGNGLSFVTLTTASLADVAPEDAGAASGLVNVAQQLGGTLGIAILVTVFGSASKHAAAHPISGGALTEAHHVFVYAADRAFLTAAAFLLVGLVLVAAVIRVPRIASAPIESAAVH